MGLVFHVLPIVLVVAAELLCEECEECTLKSAGGRVGGSAVRSAFPPEEQLQLLYLLASSGSAA